MNKKNILKENTLISIVVILLVVLAFFGSDFTVEMTPDTFMTWKNGWAEAALDHITRNGRVIMGIGYYLFGVFKLSIEQAYKVSFLLAIIFTTLSIYLLQNKFSKYIKNDFLKLLVSTTIVINPFIIEQIMCFEKGLFCLAILFTVLSSIKFIEYLEGNNKNKLYLSFVFLLLSTFTYQSEISLMIGICIPFVYYLNKKYYFKNVLHLILFFVAANISNFLFLKIFGQSTRIGVSFSLIEIINNFTKTIFDTVVMPVSMLGIMHRWIYFVVLLMLITIIFIAILKSKNKLYDVLNLICLVVLLIGCSFSSIYLGLSWIEARIIYPFGSLIGLLSLSYLLNNSKYNVPNTNYLKIVLVILLIGEMVGFQRIIIDKHKVTELDKQRTFVIGSEIDKYESETGNKVKYISFYTDKRSRDQYEGLFKSGDSCVSAYARDWSDINIINYYLNTYYTKVDNDKEIGNELYSLNEKSFSIRQLKFEGNTLHILIY